MYQGTTPTLIFKLNSSTLDLSSATEIWVTLKAYPYIEMTFDMARCTVDNDKKTISVTLTQAETLKLPASRIDTQIRLLLFNGKALATNIVRVDVNRILKGGVIE